MSKTTVKRSFVPAQASAAVAALDFRASNEAFRSALAAASGQADDPATDAAADAIAQAADQMLSIPVSAPADIAEKVVAYAWMNTLTADLSDPASQLKIASGNNDAAKGLLAIYLDLRAKADAIEAERAEWDHVVAVWETSLARLDATAHQPAEDDDPMWEAAFNAYSDAWQMLVDAPAPDAEASVYKLRTIINYGWNEELGDKPDAPAFYQRHLNEKAQDSAFPYVRLLQDACRQAGIDHPALHLERQS